jgi:phospholipid/cholesterol/gamma-HCH transport system permease protein
MTGFAEKIGSSIFIFFHNLGEIVILLGKVLGTLFKKDFPGKETIRQIGRIGYESLPVIIITSFFTGMVLAFQTGSFMEAKIKGVARFMGGGIAITMVRELGPVLTALLVAGRSGSAIAAELGTMRVTEQIDALVTLATNPIQYLILPRVIGGLIAMPLLVIFADIMGILGGGLIAHFVINQPLTIYFETVAQFIDSYQIFHGLIKATIFGFLVAYLSCAKGFGVTGGSEAVGKATTQAVVSSSMSIFFADYVVTALMN